MHGGPEGVGEVLENQRNLSINKIQMVDWGIKFPGCRLTQRSTPDPNVPTSFRHGVVPNCSPPSAAPPRWGRSAWALGITHHAAAQCQAAKMTEKQKQYMLFIGLVILAFLALGIAYYLEFRGACIWDPEKDYGDGRLGQRFYMASRAFGTVFSSALALFTYRLYKGRALAGPIINAVCVFFFSLLFYGFTSLHFDDLGRSCLK